MGAKGEILQIINSLLGTFSSRNNDIDGYWSIGKLCLYVVESNIDRIEFNLFEKTENVPTKQIAYLIGYYRAKYESIARTSNAALIQKIIFEVSFKKINDLKYSYLIKIKAITRLGKEYALSDSGTCWPHNPERELQSTRIKDF